MQSVKIGKQKLIPRFSAADFRSRDREAIIYDSTGNIKSIYLERTQDFKQKVSTFVGQIDCEMVTFYPNNKLHRVFPIYGKISGFWSEEEEADLLPDTYIHTRNYDFHGKISCICFYPDESLKSITLWPGEEITIVEKDRSYRIRFGISFYENGNLKSFEPAIPIKINHRTGIYYAYDVMATGVTGDFTSLCFDENGSIESLKSNVTGIEIVDKNGAKQEFYPQLIVNPLDIDSEILFPVKYEFKEEGITFLDSVGKVWKFLYEHFDIKAKQLLESENKVCSDFCSGNCSTCHK